jgi:hypothetical protein
VKIIVHETIRGAGIEREVLAAKILMIKDLEALQLLYHFADVPLERNQQKN